MQKLTLTQIKSTIDRPERAKRTMQALGLTKINSTIEVTNSPAVLGMILKVNHLIKVEQAGKVVSPTTLKP